MDDTTRKPYSYPYSIEEAHAMVESTMSPKWHHEHHRLHNMFPLLSLREVNDRTDDYIRKVGVKESEVMEYCSICLDSVSLMLARGSDAFAMPPQVRQDIERAQRELARKRFK